MKKLKWNPYSFLSNVELIGICVVIVLCIGIGIYIIFANVFGESWKRGMKTTMSNMTGGLERTVTAYDYDGNVLGSWTGKFDVEENDTKTFFDIDGKRVIIQNAIIINEEQ